MDRRDTMPGSYFMQRGIHGSDSGSQFALHGSTGMRSITNPNVPFQSNIGGGNIGSTLPVEPSSALPPHGVNVGAPSAVQSSEPVKRKRGRPRKYGTDGTVSLQLSPSPTSPPATMGSTQKRGRGRPPGTGRKQQLASLGQWLSGSAGMGFTPHIITIAVGEGVHLSFYFGLPTEYPCCTVTFSLKGIWLGFAQITVLASTCYFQRKYTSAENKDIATKILSFSQQGPRAVCILSANGSVSTVTLRQPSTSGGTVTYEGRFEIICLSGSYLLTDSGGSRNRTGGLSVSLASPDGRVIGGGVGGMLVAASPVQVIVGSFLWGGSKTKNKKAEGPEESRSSDHQTVDNPLSPSGVPQNQNLTPTSSVGVWPGSRAVDMRNSHVDIDLMRG